jgi:RNA polymerase sigma factor (sigma-70 family)
LRAPRRVRDLERRWIAAERELTVLLGRDPEEKEVARYVNASPVEIRDIREYRASTHVVPLDSLRAMVSSPSYTIDAVVESLTIERVLADLTPLEQKIVRAIHLQGVSVVDLAKRLGYSRRHLTRIHRVALQRLRNGCGKS